MKSIVCGAGVVGSSIAEQLSKEGLDVTVIDRSEELIKKINEKLDVKAIVGHGSNPSVLKQANASECDIFIAVTQYDEVNMVACQIAHTIFEIPTKIARIRQQDYLLENWSNLYRKNHLPIDDIISPEIEVAKAISRRLHAPGAFDILELADDKIKLIGIKCEKNCPIVNKSLRQLSKDYPEALTNIMLIIRKDKHFVPNSKTELLIGDQVYLVVETSHVNKTMSAFGHNEKESSNVIIVGGGNIGYSLAKIIEDEDNSVTAKIIELNEDRSNWLASNLKNTTVINGDALENEILEEVNISSVGSFISVTNDDEVNVLSSLLAKRGGSHECITLINNSSYISLLSNIGIDITIDPRAITISTILRKVRRGRIRSLYSIGEDFGEVIEAEINETSTFANKSIKDIALPKNVRVGAVLRDGKVIIPNSDTIFKKNDDVVFYSEKSSIKNLEKLLALLP
ncbi:MAG: Trk system potassium uptake protein TrkA [Alphaproteobacteria bacterium MarineAlpha5_Bin11]|nr:Trk system potassium transporter TrkA [Pelagibacteraceae bacterium]PPR43930.1 MAG: Trk system potassium uptake protein TrkA [Alphaproteobacteria bacterium MarineAlpha5_Bin11]|tara:strand:- start:20870 stop:22237 length:1368 start_codon:yes stop_codon:yes gene_type:complete